LPPRSMLLQRLCDWLVISLGAVAGFFALIRVGVSVEFGSVSSTTFSAAFVGLVLLCASLAGIRNRKLAAVLFLAASPVAGLFAWWPDSAPWRESLLVTLVLLAVFVGPGIFWLATRRIGWPPVWNACGVSLPRRIAAVVGTVFLLYLVVSAGVISVIVRLQAIGDCSGYDPPFVKQRFPTQAVFVANVIYLGYPRGYVAGHKASDWAVARVQRGFWGLPWWNSSFVLLTQYLFEGGEQYFVDGQRRAGLLTLGLPIVEFGTCSRSGRVGNAEVELRVLQDGPPKNGVRIIGRAMRRTHAPNYREETAPGVNVIIAGPAGSVTTTTDLHGIYDVKGLPPGRYSIHTNSYSQNWHGYPSCGLQENPALRSGDVWGCTIRID
jgi:hypothetical protein